MTRRSERSGSFVAISSEALESTLPLTRREVLQACALGAAALLLPGASRAAQSPFALPEQTQRALDQSPLIYVSPLHHDRRESSCHGEVWFMRDGASALVFTGTDRWKARALASGRDEARIWVGDFGEVKSAGDRYRKAPSFMARATRETKQAVFDRLLEKFAEKYPSEWGKWRPRFEKGWADGSRVLIRYTAIAA